MMATTNRRDRVNEIAIGVVTGLACATGIWLAWDTYRQRGERDAERFEVECTGRGGRITAEDTDAGVAFTCRVTMRGGGDKP